MITWRVASFANASQKPLVPELTTILYGNEIQRWLIALAVTVGTLIALRLVEQVLNRSTADGLFLAEFPGYRLDRLGRHIITKEVLRFVQQPALQPF